MPPPHGTPRLCYWNNIPSPYLVERLNLIAERGHLAVSAIFDDAVDPAGSWATVPLEQCAFPAVTGLRSSRAVLAHLRETRPDVVVATYAPPLHVRTLPLVQAMGTPVILRVLPSHDAWRRRRPSHEAGKRAMFRMAHGIKVPGPDGEDYVRRYAPGSRIWRVPQTVPTAHFRAPTAPDPAGPADGRPPLRYGYVGRLVREKGVLDVIAALERAEGLPPVTLAVAGTGPLADWLEPSRPDVEVEQHGFIPRADLPGFLAGLDALVFPSWGDPFGLVVEESIASGIPIIASDASGDIVDRVSARGVGIVYRSQEVGALARALVAMSDDGLRATFAARTAGVRDEIDHVRYAEAVEAMVLEVATGAAP